MFQNTSDSSEITSTFITVLRLAYLEGQGDGSWNKICHGEKDILVVCLNKWRLMSNELVQTM
jgi:hypothetical protein